MGTSRPTETIGIIPGDHRHHPRRPSASSPETIGRIPGDHRLCSLLFLSASEVRSCGCARARWRLALRQRTPGTNPRCLEGPRQTGAPRTARGSARRPGRWSARRHRCPGLHRHRVPPVSRPRHHVRPRAAGAERRAPGGLPHLHLPRGGPEVPGRLPGQAPLLWRRRRPAKLLPLRLRGCDRSVMHDHGLRLHRQRLHGAPRHQLGQLLRPALRQRAGGLRPGEQVGDPHHAQPGYLPAERRRLGGGHRAERPLDVLLPALS